jgi:uncharacterized damage-inducible protein DinB
MPIADWTLQELAHEFPDTRKVLERVPDADLDWRPHPKSMTSGMLACHLAEIPGLAEPIIRQDELDLDVSKHKPLDLKKVADILKAFDENTSAARNVLEGTSDQKLMAPWTFKVNGNVVFTVPRIAALRLMVLSHSCHHRGQMSVYLRLRNVAVPSVYGPTADEGMGH